MNEFENQNNNVNNNPPTENGVVPNIVKNESVQNSANGNIVQPISPVAENIVPPVQENTQPTVQENNIFPPNTSNSVNNVPPVYNQTPPVYEYKPPVYTPPVNYSQPPQYNNPPQNTQPPLGNPIVYTQPTPPERKSASKGLKVFCLVLVAVIVATGSCMAGYLFGKGDNKVTSPYGNVSVDLASKPKDTDEYTAAEVYAMVDESVVGIRVYNSEGKASSATGVIYSEDGYIVTNDHIYSQIAAPAFVIYMSDGTEYYADYVAGDVISDLAVLKIRSDDEFKPAVFGNSNEIVCGENVVAVGRPSDATDPSSVTKGIISLTSRRVQTTSNYSARLIQTDSAINPGSSGGALVNMYGQVIGITSSKISGNDYDLVGFAIPTTTVKRVVEQLISKGKVVDRAKLGITYTMIDSVTADVSGYDSVGLYVQSVATDSDLYGKIKEGDTITKVNGVAVTNDDIVLDIIESCKAGDSITLTVVTERGSEKEYTAELKANIGESSYKETLEKEDQPTNEGTFDFPFGD